jgi:hypothetical protein
MPKKPPEGGLPSTVALGAVATAVGGARQRQRHVVGFRRSGRLRRVRPGDDGGGHWQGRDAVGGRRRRRRQDRKAAGRRPGRGRIETKRRVAAQPGEIVHLLVRLADGR